jgi:hypothetical protein
MGSNSNKSYNPNFANIMPFSALSVISGVIEISSISQNQIVACVFGILGITNFFLSLKFDTNEERDVDEKQIRKNLTFWDSLCR